MKSDSEIFDWLVFSYFRRFSLFPAIFVMSSCVIERSEICEISSMELLREKAKNR